MDCIGVEKPEELKDLAIHWQVAIERSKLKAIPQESKLGSLLRQLEAVNAKLGSTVERPFCIVRNGFGQRKVPHKWLKRNTRQLHILFGIANLVIAKRLPLVSHS